jgi:type IV pilus assembly protein PilZ
MLFYMTHDSLTLTIKDQSSLHAAYMSFLRRGGLFVPTAVCYQLGDQVAIVLSLLDEPETVTVSGRVVWITPKGAQGSRETGIGVEFSEQDAAVSHKIENYLGGSLASSRQTHTL